MTTLDDILSAFYLIDDGTLDTVIGCKGEVHRYSPEFAAHYRNYDGSLRFDELVGDISSDFDYYWESRCPTGRP